jgi:hypothetical protein
MTFVKRVDGMTYYEGGHVVARKIGGEKKSKKDIDEDLVWEAAAETAMISLGEAAYLREEIEEDEEFSDRLWGKYEGDCPTLRKEFEGIFRR